MFRPEAVPFDVFKSGIPPERRAEVWITRSGARDKKEAAGVGYYDALVQSEAPEGDRAQIKKDVRRSGIEDKAQQDILRRVLLAYSQRNKVVGYCQGMNFLCTVLIQQLHDEEWVFWVFAAILENILVPDFYAKAPQLIGFQIDNNVLLDLMQAQVRSILCKTLSNILEEDLESMCSFLSPQWLMALYVHAVPEDTVPRIWDCMFYEGSVALFRVALAIISIFAPMIQDQEPQERLLTLRTEAMQLDAELLMVTAYMATESVPTGVELRRIRDKHRRSLYVQNFSRPSTIQQMQNRKFGARHLQLIEQQYNYVVDRDDAIAAGLSLRQFKGLLKQLGKSDPIFKVVDHGIGVSRLFRLLNVSGTGRVTKAEVVCGFLLIVDGSIEQKLEMLFHSFDKAGRGRLTRPAVLRLIITLLTMAYDQGTKSTDPGSPVDYASIATPMLRRKDRERIMSDATASTDGDDSSVASSGLPPLPAATSTTPASGGAVVTGATTHNTARRISEVSGCAASGAGAGAGASADTPASASASAEAAAAPPTPAPPHGGGSSPTTPTPPAVPSMTIDDAIDALVEDTLHRDANTMFVDLRYWEHLGGMLLSDSTPLFGRTRTATTTSRLSAGAGGGGAGGGGGVDGGAGGAGGRDRTQSAVSVSGATHDSDNDAVAGYGVAQPDATTSTGHVPETEGGGGASGHAATEGASAGATPGGTCVGSSPAAPPAGGAAPAAAAHVDMEAGTRDRVTSLRGTASPRRPVMLKDTQHGHDHMRMSLRTLRSDSSNTAHEIQTSARTFVHRLFRHCDEEGDGEISMSAFITGCLSLPLVTQCFDWIGAETAGELAEERHATTTMVAETQEQAAAEQEQQKQLAMAKQQDELQAAVAAVGDVTLGMDQAVLDEAVLQGQELDGRESQPARRPSRRLPGRMWNTLSKAVRRKRHHRSATTSLLDDNLLRARSSSQGTPPRRAPQASSSSALLRPASDGATSPSWQQREGGEGAVVDASAGPGAGAGSAGAGAAAGDGAGGVAVEEAATQSGGRATRAHSGQTGRTPPLGPSSSPASFARGAHTRAPGEDGGTCKDGASSSVGDGSRSASGEGSVLTPQSATSSRRRRATKVHTPIRAKQAGCVLQ